MRKDFAVARDLPLQRGAQRIGIDRDQHQVFNAGKTLGCGRADLNSGGEMNKAAAGIDATTAKHASTPRLPPQHPFAALENAARHASAPPTALPVFPPGSFAL